MPLKVTNFAPLHAYRDFKQQGLIVMQDAQGAKAMSAAGNLTNIRAKRLENSLTTARNYLDVRSAVPGFSDAAKTIEANPTYDVVAEYAAMRAQLQNTITLINTSVPTPVDGAQPITYTAAATEPLRSQLDLLIAAME